MSDEFNPGDVALLDYSHDGAPRILVGVYTTKGHWRTQSDTTASGLHAKSVRRLVVIDPEGREQVERLLVAFKWPKPIPSYAVDDMQAALREFANPIVKPEEPTGLGAVVEDDQGVKYVRAGITHDGAMEDCWRHVTGSNIGYWSKWHNIAAVRVLSEGVTP